MRAILDSMRSRPLLPLIGVTGAIVWAYWPTLCEIAGKWSHDPQYSHGYFVPAFAVYLLWQRRKLAPATCTPNWWGAALLLVAVSLRGGGALFYNDWLDAVSLLPLLSGVVLLLGGWPMLRWSWLAIGFLIFMIPLPFRLEHGLAHPLQRVATLTATYTLQTLGFPTFAEGNVIHVRQASIGVVEACSGLGMLLLFFALATGVAILTRRPFLDKVLIVASAAPVAVLANVIRITTTAFLHVIAGSRWADLVFHDLAGYLMMPLALGMLWVELWLLRRLLIERPLPSLAPIRLVIPQSSGPRRRPRRARVPR
ncbi:MAG TPA: exosortase/archaeosortase family protein [Gemmataceae bacterium]|nr:exosortase/archaeosortase family protein [Gemmataceae bacterium]